MNQASFTVKVLRRREGENPKKTPLLMKYVYQLTKSMHKTITSLFLQKSLEVYLNSGI